MAWNQSNANRYLRLTSPITNMASTPIYSEALPNTVDPNGYKIYVGITVSVTSGGTPVVPLKLQSSPDGVTWTTYATLIADTDPETVADKWAIYDMTGLAMPFYRFVLNDTSQTMAGTGRFTFNVILSVAGSIYGG